MSNKQILIPRIAKTSQDGNTFYVRFPYEFEKLFDEWCDDNNIGYEKHNRQDVIKSDCAVFTENKSIFI